MMVSRRSGVEDGWQGPQERRLWDDDCVTVAAGGPVAGNIQS